MAEEHQDIDIDGPEGHISCTVKASVRQRRKIDAGIPLADEERDQGDPNCRHEPQEANVGSWDANGQLSVQEG